LQFNFGILNTLAIELLVKPHFLVLLATYTTNEVPVTTFKFFLIRFLLHNSRTVDTRTAIAMRTVISSPHVAASATMADELLVLLDGSCVCRRTSVVSWGDVNISVVKVESSVALDFFVVKFDSSLSVEMSCVKCGFSVVAFDISVVVCSVI